MEKVRLGIAGPGRIVRRVMKDLWKAEHIELAAVASRSAERGRAAAEAYGIPLVFEGYERMAESDAVDLVYVALPHPFHCQATKLFLSHGKHVITEKPFALNAKEAREMADCAKRHGRFLMEAMWSRFFPAALELKRRIAAGELGEIRYLSGSFSSRLAFDPKSRLFDLALGGGGLLDVGVYVLSLACYYKGALPADVQTYGNLASSGADTLCSFQLRFPDGAVGQGFCGLEVPAEDTMRICGTEAWAELPGFWHPTRFSICRFRQEPELHTFPAENEGFHYEFEAAALAILAGKAETEVMPPDESVGILQVTDQMRRQMGVRYPGEE